MTKTFTLFQEQRREQQRSAVSEGCAQV